MGIYFSPNITMLFDEKFLLNVKHQVMIWYFARGSKFQINHRFTMLNFIHY